jgi:hypothetical protein
MKVSGSRSRACILTYIHTNIHSDKQCISQKSCKRLILEQKKSRFWLSILLTYDTHWSRHWYSRKMPILLPQHWGNSPKIVPILSTFVWFFTISKKYKFCIVYPFSLCPLLFDSLQFQKITKFVLCTRFLCEICFKKLVR